MRRKLAEEVGLRKRFKATFARFGKKVNFNGYSETTLLFTSIIDIQTSQLVSDHQWFSYTKGFEKINFKEGVVIMFDARIKEYNKGYVNRQLNVNNRKTDFKLSHPTNIAVFV